MKKSIRKYFCRGNKDDTLTLCDAPDTVDPEILIIGQDSYGVSVYTYLNVTQVNDLITQLTKWVDNTQLNELNELWE